MQQCFDSIHRQQHTQCCLAGELGMYACLLCIQCTTSSKGNDGWREVVMCVCVCVFSGRRPLNTYLIDPSLIFFRVGCTEHISQLIHHINR